MTSRKLKQLSKRAAIALEALKAGGGFWTGVMPNYSTIGLDSVEVRTVLMGPENKRIKGVGAAALSELEAAGFEFVATNEMLGTVHRLKTSNTVSP
jgi:hypothetical protein